MCRLAVSVGSQSGQTEEAGTSTWDEGLRLTGLLGEVQREQPGRHLQ